ncbi:WHI2-like protein P4H10,16c [Ceratobasidium theobromae]|uniref:WHI2-like protein P4H10,16c n=1 Tax=Ceratobasidium theobromae TaxID=1582974 RepID=A0A5N5QJU0_9AGAM|nr:WHI2-like protein P4H10,16c [Ceratobasidium theobromae]
MPCEVVSPLPFLRPAPFSYPTRMASSSPRTKLHGLGFTAVSPEATSSPPRSRKGSGAKKANGQRRSCPTSPSASFVSLHRMQAGMPPDPVCIRSRSSSHPHLSYTSSVFTPALDLGSPYFSLAPGYLGIVPMDDSDTERDQLMFGVHHSSTIGTTIGRMRHLPRLRSKDKLKRQDVTETETEREGPARVLPTARGPAHHRPSATPLMARLIPLVLFLFRLLAVVPATIGTIGHVRNAFYPKSHTRVDFVVAACWSVLTGFQCWFLTSGLLVRWRAYYPLLSTLVRLLALQAICWPATHITLSVLDVGKRPTVCWAVVGTTTCISRAIQLWATSNLGPMERGQRVIYGRKWDWGDVALKCGFPCAMVYFVMAWGAVLNRELGLSHARVDSVPTTTMASAASPITQVSQTPAGGLNLAGQPQLLARLQLDLRGIRFSVDREKIMNLPESVLLCLFPNGLVLSRQSVAGSSGYEEEDGEDVYIVDFDPDCFAYVLEFFRVSQERFYGTSTTPGLLAAQQALLDGSTSPSSSPGMDYNSPNQNPLLSKQAIIVLREELEYFVIPPDDGGKSGAGTDQHGIANQVLLDMKRESGVQLLEKRHIFTALQRNVNKENNVAEQHLIDMLCMSGFNRDDTWGYRALEPSRCCISSIALVLLKTGISHPADGSPVTVDQQQMGTAQKLLLFWRKPARKCWWDGAEAVLPATKTSPSHNVKLWARRVWTLELSLVSPIPRIRTPPHPIPLRYNQSPRQTIHDHDPFSFSF